MNAMPFPPHFRVHVSLFFCSKLESVATMTPERKADFFYFFLLHWNQMAKIDKPYIENDKF